MLISKQHGEACSLTTECDQTKLLGCFNNKCGCESFNYYDIALKKCGKLIFIW